MQPDEHQIILSIQDNVRKQLGRYAAVFGIANIIVLISSIYYIVNVVASEASVKATDIAITQTNQQIEQTSQILKDMNEKALEDAISASVQAQIAKETIATALENTAGIKDMDIPKVSQFLTLFKNNTEQVDAALSIENRLTKMEETSNRINLDINNNRGMLTGLQENISRHSAVLNTLEGNFNSIKGDIDGQFLMFGTGKTNNQDPSIADIVFDTPFLNLPIVVATTINAKLGQPVISNITTNGFRLKMVELSSNKQQTYTNTEFHYIAVGEKSGP